MRAYKCEKKAEDKLMDAGLECFVPKHYVVRAYHGVKSKRLVPAIPSLVFVHAEHASITNFKKKYNFLQFVTWKQATRLEYIIISDREMENFMKVAAHYEEDVTFYKPEEINLKKGMQVRIHGGKFDGVTGLFMRVRGKRNRRVVVLLGGVLAAAAEIHPDLIEVIS